MRSFSGGVGGVVYKKCSFLIAVSIAAMNRRTESMADALHPALFRSDVKRTTRPDEHSSHVDALFRACCDYRSNHIPCLVALDLFGSFGF